MNFRIPWRKQDVANPAASLSAHYTPSLPEDEDQWRGNVVTMAAKAAYLDTSEGASASDVSAPAAPSIGHFLNNERAISARYQDEIAHIEESTRRRLREADALRYDSHADVVRLRDEVLAQPQRNAVSQPLDEALAEVRKERGRFRGEAKRLCADLDAAIASKNHFELLHPVTPPARYTRSPLTSAAWLLSTVTAEVVVNSLMFLPTTTRGLAGSLFEVLGFAPLNVAAAVVIGLFSLRYIRHRSRSWRMLAWTSLVGLVGFVGLFNLFLTAVRIAVASFGAISVATAFNSLLSRQVLEVVDAQSLSVLLSGLAFATFAAWKAYRIYDPYPGYAVVQKEVEHARGALSDAEQEHNDAIADLGEEAARTMSRNLARAYELSANHRALLDTSRADLQFHNKVCQALVEAHNASIRKFRGAYLSHPALSTRALGAPPELVLTSVDDGLTEAERNGGEVENAVALLDKASNQYLARLSDAIADAQDETSQLVTRIQQEVRRIVVRPYGEEDDQKRKAG